MAERTSQSIIEDATRYIEEQGGLGMFIVNVGFGSILMSAIYGMVDTTQAAFLLIWSPLEGLALSFTDVVNAVIGGQADIVFASIETAVMAFQSGATAELGPLAPLVAILVIGGMTYLMVVIWRRIPISPLTFIMGDD